MTQPHPAATSGRWPEGRYGHRREPRRQGVAVALVALLVAAFLAISWQLYRSYGARDYSASVTSFTDITDEQVVVTFVVRLPEGAEAVCVVRARGASGAEVGREEVAVSAGSDPGETEVSYRLATTARPVTGEVQGCRPA